MDILTPVGQETLKHESHMLDRIRFIWNKNIIETDKDTPAVCDGFINQSNDLKGLFESKCRDMSIDKLKEYGSWLISWEKVYKCSWLSKHICTPFYGFLYLIPSDIILTWQITDNTGKPMFEIKKEERETQRSCNGGTKIDHVALLPVEYASYLEPYL